MGDSLLYHALLRAGALASTLAALPVLAGCGGGVSVPAAGSPTSAPAQAIAYTAIGASDAVGYGASVSCNTAQNPPLVAVPTCPGGTGYVPVLARQLIATGKTVTLNDLGISGGVLGPDILKLANMYGAVGSANACQPRVAGVDAYPADFITAELPSVPATATLVTVFAGGNDTNGIVNALGCGAGGTTLPTQIAFIQMEITNFGRDFEQLLTSVHAKAPNAKIVVANLPNFSLIPVGQQQSAAARQALQAVSVGIDQNVINTAAASGIPVVDLLCNPQSYVPANFFTDGFHPNDAGYLAFAQAFFAQVTATTPAAPQTTCSFATTTTALQRPLLEPIRDFTR